jgi:endonuclease-8
MPEGHTIHRAARDQRRLLQGHPLAVSSPQGRFEAGAARLDGATCTEVEAYGKHLIYRFEGALALHIHLGLFGRFRTGKRPEPEPKGAVRVRLLSPGHVVDINGPNTCEVLEEAELAALLARIGPDLLRPDADPERAWRRVARSRTAIGQLLMDQSVMAGIGNIYRTELLWRQGVHPEMPGKAVPREAFDRLWADGAALLAIGVEKNAIITVDGVKRSRTKYRERVNIFGKPQCPRCAGAVRRFTMATRRIFVCEGCQPPPAGAP